jgi:crotonobetainyl-CoA:carnitine CoA-transferase CaiB-like acyl-CoA transferase
MLEKMKVLSFCHVLQGPACTQYLADLGADVVKIEPVAGERARRWPGPHIGGVSGLYLCAFRNKRTFAVDLKNPEGIGIVKEMVRRADVVVENYRTGVMDRLGLGYEALRREKPDLIYASGTGWGSKGPMIERASQDIIIQARTGLMAATGHDRAKAVGSAIVDQHGGAVLAMGIIAAYVKKLTTGQGTKVESSLYTAGLDLQAEPLTVYLSTRPGRQVFQRDENLATWYHQAPYGQFKLADAEIAMSVNDPMKVADALDSDELRALAGIDRFKERDRYARVFAAVVANRKFADVAAAFDKAEIWYSRIYDFDDVADDPQAAAVDAFNEIEIRGEKAVLVNHPVRYDDQTPPLRIRAYAIGEHTREVLSELGYTDARIDELVARRVIAAAEPEALVPAE